MMNKLEIIKSRILKEYPTHEDWVVLRAMLCTLNERECVELENEGGSLYYTFIVGKVLPKIFNEPSPIKVKPIVRNRSIAAELKDFENYKRGQRTYLRRNLQIRLPYVSYSEQCKILNVLLYGVKTDRMVAYKFLENNWDELFIKDIQRNFELFSDVGAAKLILKHSSENYLRPHIEVLRELCGYVSVYLRFSDEPIDIRRVTPVQYLYLLAKFKRTIDTYQAEAILYHHIFSYLFTEQAENIPKSPWSLLSIPDVSLIIWSFGHLHLFESILQFEKLNAQVIHSFNSFNTTPETFKVNMLMLLENYRHYYDAFVARGIACDMYGKQSIIQRFTKENADVQTLLNDLDLV